ncbi:MAG: rhodanese-like domain-containing protein [Kaiparowitsia implicata GSE-PSE-MK54-09C]|jgi:rhodanese-related sulfurtransferase|nr:rhodanese-like domain-containing protein [Kaiparowitsia implicata GSE-PSE-MK54-09C]
MNTGSENLNPETIESNAQRVQGEFQAAHKQEESAVGKAKDSFNKNIASKLPVPTPGSSMNNRQASAFEVKSRLMWGEPGLTILDVRDRSSFQSRCIQGAMNAPISTLPDSVQNNMQTNRDVYVYGSNADEAANAAQMLREAGFQSVSQIEGGLASWEEIQGPLDGVDSQDQPGPGAYNLLSRLKAFSNERAKEAQMAR